VSSVKWGILSTAKINSAVIPAAHASEKVELLGVASRDQARADSYAAHWEIPRGYGSYESLLADDEIEAVYISLPNNLHVTRATCSRRPERAGSR
jgi:xylose dehydrogenase (NAD/NADP)